MNALQSRKNGRSDAEEEQKNIQITFAAVEDLDSLVALHYQCFSEKDHIAMRFGKPFMVAAYRWFVTSPETFTLIAKQGDSLIGFSTVADRPYNPPMLRACWREALSGLMLRPWIAFHPELVRRLLRLLFRRYKEYIVRNKVAHIAYMGVDPQVQGVGIGKALVSATIRTCRERGMNEIIVGIMRKNKRSIAVHERAGFREVPELGTKRFVYLRLELNKDAPSS
jgi:GNAT superfamily N-acetyltransferase